MIDIQLTPNFRLSEFINSSTADKFPVIKAQQYLLDYDTLANIIEVAHKLQSIRDHLGMGIYITSGYRCPKLNYKVNGSKTSAHLKGLAVDISCMDNDLLFDSIKKTVDYDQIICYGDNPIRFIHLGFTHRMTPRKQILQRP